MLQQMRKVSKSWVATLFMGVLALSFGFWGIADIFRGSTDTSIATVGGIKINSSSFARDYTNLRRNAAARNGGQLTPAQALALGHAALQHTIDDAALDNAVKALGLTATDGQVSSNIRAIPAFRGPLGTFDQTTFEQALERIGYNQSGFIEEMRAELTRDQLIHAGSNAILLPPGYVRAFFNYLNERRAVQYIVLPPDAAGAIPAPSDAVLAAYVKAHADRFSTPEYREVTYATIGPDDVAAGLQVSDAQLREAYELRKDTYVIPEKRDIQRINFTDEASAKAARAKIDAGAKFEDIAAARGMKPADLALDGVTEADLANQGPAAFALPMGGISQPLKYTFGWSLLRVTKITPGSTTTFEQAKPQLKNELVAQLAASKIEDIVNAFDDARNAGASLDEAAKKVGMRVVHVAAVDARGLAPDGTRAAVPASPDFLAQLFKADVGDEGDPFAAADGNRYVLKVDGVTPQKLKPLDSVRADVTAAWIAEQRRQKLADAAKAFAAEVSARGNLASIAARLHVALQKSGALLRDTPTPTLPQALINAIFASPPGRAVSGATATADGSIVAQITGVMHVPLPLGDPRYQQFVQALSDQASKDIADSMAAAARAQQGVTINQQQADRVLGGEGS